MSGRWSGRALRWVWAIGVFVRVLSYIATSNAAPAASDWTEQLRYQVRHSVFGNIGTYTNIVQRIGDMTTVQTTAHFLVTALGVGLHREDAERTERWQGDRLVSFSGVTKKNDETIALKGEARGNDFVIVSPAGTFIAPATVQPANPWSAKCLNSTTLMRVDDGKIEKVRVTGGSAGTVEVNGTTIAAREYEIDGGTRYRIWFDRNNVPIMFVVDDDSGKITFTLDPVR
jgi:hypothetical protein